MYVCQTYVDDCRDADNAVTPTLPKEVEKSHRISTGLADVWLRMSIDRCSLEPTT